MTKASWQIAADRAAIGQPVALQSIKPEEGEYTITPRKYTVAGNDAITAIALKIQARMKRESLKAIVDSGLDSQEMQTNEGASDEEKRAAIRKRNDLAIAVLADVPEDLLGQRETMRAKIRHGVALHTMEGEPKAPVDEWIEAVLDYPETAAEIVAIVEGFNRPLAQTTPKASAM